ncbi:MAG: 4Fe-4S dicluster domain-containing protein [Desulfobacterales bacterium]|nr:4Fe-4S dicluster domain-containing protein [Desulfobacterales bacterium]MBF0396267.1 4Fe-4S dicluster domain-containing protein [Desulfobacterales bacterium]
MEESRRSFLKIAGIAAFGLSAIPAIDIFASESSKKAPAPAPDFSLTENSKALSAKRWGMVIDTRKFKSEKDLEHIMSVCHSIHNVPNMTNKRHEIKWIWSEEYPHAFVGDENEYLSEKLAHTPIIVLCNHCQNPPCVRACPTQATFKRQSDGIVMMDMHRCIGCRFCIAACPYGARSFNFRDPRPFISKTNLEYPTRMKGVVEKCTFCVERLAIGKIPACVEASNGAIIFGDLENPDSEIRKLLKNNFTIRRKQHLGTGPSVYYIV